MLDDRAAVSISVRGFAIAGGEAERDTNSLRGTTITVLDGNHARGHANSPPNAQSDWMKSKSLPARYTNCTATVLT